MFDPLFDRRVFLLQYEFNDKNLVRAGGFSFFKHC
jgi:hypothetical protein